MHFGDTTYWRGLWIYGSCSKFPPARKIAYHVRKLLTASKVASMRRRWWKTLWILCLEWRECKVRTNTTILVRQTRYRAKLCGSFGLSLYTWPICPNLKLRLGPIQQFWFAKPDTEPNWVVRSVRHDTLPICKQPVAGNPTEYPCSNALPSNL